MRPGRPKITTERVNRRILEISNADPFKSVPKILAQLINEGKMAPSVYTIRNRLRQNDKHGRVARKIPFISKTNKQKRREFYEEHILKPPNFWHTVLWTDESMIRLKYSHGMVYVWRNPSEQLKYKCTLPTFKSLERGLMIWGCLSANGTGSIVVLEGKMTAAVYLKILEETAIPEGRRLIGQNFILQQDNAPIHTAKLIKDYFRRENINVLKWPPQSPDLSPIENAWAILKMRISEDKPQKLEDLKDCIIRHWANFPRDQCLKLVDSMTHRLGKMAIQNFGHCGY